MKYIIGNKYTQHEIDKANVLAFESEKSLAKEVGKYKGQQDLMFARTSDLFRPITSTSTTAAKQEADEDQKKAIMDDPNLTAEEKAKVLARIDLTKLEKHTPKDEVRKTPEEIRDIEIGNAFAIADDPIFGLVQVEGVPE